jgi:DNA-binding NarL/FixJ family response regulator
MGKTELIRLFLVDDHQVIRQGLASILSGEPDIEVVGEASSGEEAIEKLRKMSPDIVLMDISMPDSDGFETAEYIKKSNPRIAVIMLTGYDSELYAAESLRAGASGYLTKDSPRKFLLNAIRLVANGGTVWKRGSFPGYRPEPRVKGDKAPLTPEANAKLLKTAFTARELEILKLLGQGYGNKQIVATLNLSDATIKKHIKSIINKMGAKNRTQAVLFAVKLGLT